MSKKLSTFAGITVGMIAVAALFVGCPKSEPKLNSDTTQLEAGQEEQAPEMSPVDALFMKADELYSAGATNEAIAALEGGLTDPELKDNRQQVFNMLIRMMTYSDMLDKAKERMLDVYANDADMAVGAVGLIYTHYVDSLNDIQGAVDWTEKVLAIPTLPPAVRRNMREWNFSSHIQAGNEEKVIKLADGLVRDAPAGDAIQILQRGVDTLFDRKQLGTVEKILANAGKIISSDVGTRNLVAASRLRLFAEQGKWEQLSKSFFNSAASLPDADLQRTFRRVLAAAGKARQDALTDSLSQFVITNFTDKTQTSAVAARQWTDNAARLHPAELPDRIELLMNRKFQPSLMCGIFLRYFYDIIDDPAIVGDMRDIGERLSLIAPDDDTRNSIRTMVLDSCFILEDYDKALKILREGVAGYDKTWHDMAISKVEAHKALKENKPLEAIKAFRAFMAIVEISKDQESADPSTGVLHTKEMILGRNAKRIGDIYRTQVKDEASAKAAYAEARKYYQVTLDSKPEQEVLDIVKAEMAEIPQ